MNIAQIADFCTQTVGDIDQDTVAFAKKAIRLRYQLLYAAHSWQEAIQSFTLSIADTDTFFLPLDCELIVFAVPVINGVKYCRLAYRERDWIEQNAAIGPYLTNYGPIPCYFYRAVNLALPTLSPGLLTFTVKDTTPINLYVAGSDSSGNFLNEKMLAGTSDSTNPSVTTSINSYALVATISKGVSVYPVIVTAQDGTSVQMTPGATELVYTRGGFWPPLTGAAQLLVGAKLRADSLEDDMSVPRISRLWNALIGFTNAALYKRQRQLGKAQVEAQDAMAIVQAAVSEEKNQAAFRQQVVPQMYDGNFYPWGAAQYPTSSWPWSWGWY